MIAMTSKADALNPAMTFWLQSEHLWRQLGDLRR